MGSPGLLRLEQPNDGWPWRRGMGSAVAWFAVTLLIAAGTFACLVRFGVLDIGRIAAAMEHVDARLLGRIMHQGQPLPAIV